MHSPVYTEAKDTMSEKIKEVLNFSPGKLEQEVEKGIISDVDAEKWNKLYLNICYNRYECSALGIVYHTFDLATDFIHNNNLMQLDEIERRRVAGNRIKVTALYLLQENPDYIPPSYQ